MAVNSIEAQVELLYDSISLIRHTLSNKILEVRSFFIQNGWQYAKPECPLHEGSSGGEVLKYLMTIHEGDLPVNLCRSMLEDLIKDRPVQLLLLARLRVKISHIKSKGSSTYVISTTEDNKNIVHYLRSCV